MSDDIDAIVFFGHGGRLVMQASDYERPSAQDPYDANWLNTTVSVQCAVFSGSFKAAFSTYDFAQLHRQLDQALENLSGTVHFESAEGDLTFAIELTHRGTAAVSGVAKPNEYPDASLSFKFETDQSVLSEAVRQLAHLLRRLPVREP